MIRKAPYLLLVALFALGLAACGGNAEEAAGPAVIELGPVGNEMKYDRTEFTVQPGQEVRIVFTNTATSPAMNHNVVVLVGEEAIERVGTAAIEAGEAREYVPEDEAIIAYTPLSAPGETVEVTFTAPTEEGDYPFICTFPGHYMLMQGVMHVTSEPAA